MSNSTIQNHATKTIDQSQIQANSDESLLRVDKAQQNGLKIEDPEGTLVPDVKVSNIIGEHQLKQTV